MSASKGLAQKHKRTWDVEESEQCVPYKTQMNP